MGTLRRQQDFLLQLLFDQELRENFFSDRQSVINEYDLDDEDVALFADLDRFGLEVDARLRRDYVLSALCRPYPLTAAAVGCTRPGRAALCQFLASPKLRADLQTRTAAFGDHLQRLLEYQAIGLPPEVSRLLQPVLALERARVDNAAAMRNAINTQGQKAVPPAPKPASAKEVRGGKMALPPYCLLAELQLPVAVLEAALDHVGPHNAWALIRSASLSLGRLTTLARALPMPVTVLSRGVARGLVSERAGAGGVSPLIDVSHVVAEVSGRHAQALSTLDGRHRLAELPAALARLAQPLAEQGLLQLS